MEITAGQGGSTEQSLPNGAVLSQHILLQRLRKGDLVVSPILEKSQVGDGSVDVSLGTRFIRSRRSKTLEIDFPTLNQEMNRSFQESVVVPFGEHTYCIPAVSYLAAPSSLLPSH